MHIPSCSCTNCILLGKSLAYRSCDRKQRSPCDSWSCLFKLVPGQRDLFSPYPKFDCGCLSLGMVSATCAGLQLPHNLQLSSAILCKGGQTTTGNFQHEGPTSRCPSLHHRTRPWRCLGGPALRANQPVVSCLSCPALVPCQSPSSLGGYKSFHIRRYNCPSSFVCADRWLAASNRQHWLCPKPSKAPEELGEKWPAVPEYQARETGSQGFHDKTGLYRPVMQPLARSASICFSPAALDTGSTRLWQPHQWQ